MSKTFLLVFLLLVPLPGIADDYNYEVYGYGDDGYVSGEVEINLDSKEVEGYLYTDDGEVIYIEGEGIGSGTIECYDDEGNYYELEAY